MAVIKSSSEHLTLNADGALKDIKFQADGVEKASISSSGLFTSTTIDATKLTGNLPAISGANLTGVGAVGMDDVSGVARATSGLLFNGDTASANALDDYEEGNWTPTWSPTNGSWSGTGGGKYTKVGRQVTASFNWLASSQATGTKFNAVGGLPFTSLNETATYPAIVTMNGGGASGNMLNATVGANSTSVNLQMQPDGTGTHGEFTPAQTNSSCEISLTVTYMTT